MITHCQVAENIVFSLVPHGITSCATLLGQAIKCSVLISTWASYTVFTRCWARPWLCPIQTLKVVLEVLKWHILRSSSWVWSCRRRHLIIDWLKVPGQALKTHSCGRLETRWDRAIMLALLKLWVTVAIFNPWSFYFFALSSLAFRWGSVSRNRELRVYEILVVLSRKFHSHRCAYCFRVEILAITTLTCPRKLTANPGQ